MDPQIEPSGMSAEISEPSVRFSTIVPIFNEEENIPELHTRLTSVLEELCRADGVNPSSFEILLVDDGSTDRSWEIIEGLHRSDPRVKGLRFSRNFGHHMAITAGLDHACGDTLVLMDGDLQDPPEEIPKLYEKYKEGNDLVYGIRQERHDPFLKKLTSRLFWWLIRRFSGVDMPQGQTMLRILSRRVADVLRRSREYARFVHGLMAWAGFRTTCVEVEHSPRTRGQSKYNISRLFRLAFNAITSFSVVPLRLATYLGIASALMGIIFSFYIVYKKLISGIPVLGYASIIVAVLFIGGVQLIMLGLFGEYLGRIYQEVQKRPLYIIDQALIGKEQ